MRTIHGRFLLRPSPEVNDLILGIVGRAQEHFPVRIHAFVVLSNHAHWLLSVDNAAQLAGFMGFVCGNVAREIGGLHDWRHRFWARRYRAIVVADETSAVARLRYLLCHGCKENLVERPKDWPGVSCIKALTSRSQLFGTWFDRTAEGNARRRGEKVAAGRFARRYQVTLTPLPCWNSLSPALYRRACAEIVAEIEVQERNRRGLDGPVLGVAAVLSQLPHDQPAAFVARPAPLVHASSREVARVFVAGYRAFVDAFRYACDCLRRGVAASFPEGAFPPAPPWS